MNLAADASPRTVAYRREAEAVLGPDLAARMSSVKLMVFDADGVLTPGNLIFGPDGEALKEFHSHDGLGLVMARIAGIKRAVLTGRNSKIVERRCTELRFDAIKLGRFDKTTALQEIIDETGCTLGETLYMGDDYIDLPPLQMVGVPVGVPAAPPEVKEACVHVTETDGGVGAVREMTDLVLKSAGLFELALGRLQDRAWLPTGKELSSERPSGTVEEESQ